MPAITQLAPSAVSMKRYASFAGKEVSLVAPIVPTTEQKATGLLLFPPALAVHRIKVSWRIRFRLRLIIEEQIRRPEEAQARALFPVAAPSFSLTIESVYMPASIPLAIPLKVTLKAGVIQQMSDARRIMAMVYGAMLALEE